jgi:hypothetical protein
LRSFHALVTLKLVDSYLLSTVRLKLLAMRVDQKPFNASTKPKCFML